ncbi:MAG: hypothetical protein FWD60_13835 [Candidatus Azobacteroides sp.]|nr:hypothetical protein [Candidatus Azobacteroides sp.]
MKIYNKKAFLLPDSINSCSMYHAKIFEDGKYIFRIHDCLTGIRFRGDLNTEENITEAYRKITCLIQGLWDFKEFISDNFIKKG